MKNIFIYIYKNISRRRRENFFEPFLVIFLYIYTKIFRAEGANFFLSLFLYIYIKIVHHFWESGPIFLYIYIKIWKIFLYICIKIFIFKRDLSTNFNTAPNCPLGERILEAPHVVKSFELVEKIIFLAQIFFEPRLSPIQSIHKKVSTRGSSHSKPPGSNFFFAWKYWKMKTIYHLQRPVII